MELKTVTSSNIKAVGYDKDTLLLIVEFHSGKKYAYSDVPPAVYTGFLEAKSMGIFFSRNVRSNYNYERLA
jgi:hypothetical protein